MSIELQPVTSTNIKAAGYSPETKTLVVQFASDAKYKYADFPQWLWNEFSATFGGGEE